MSIPLIDDRLGLLLLAVARDSLAAALGCLRGEPTAASTSELDPWREVHGAAFVTLRRGNELRGCVGSLEACRPLIDDVRENAVNAGLKDPRFAPVSGSELEEIAIEVSVLSPPEPLACASEADALAQLLPGADGLVLSWRQSRSTLLPQVWESLRTPGEFLACLKQKAGLAVDFWDDEVRLYRYRAQSWCESASIRRAR